MSPKKPTWCDSATDSRITAGAQGIMVFRFYIRCTRCNAEITFKTDPQNSDYSAEHGCARNFEPWRDKEKKEEALNEAKDKVFYVDIWSIL